jgi:hypothetical protein
MRTHSKPHSKQRAKVRALAAQGLNSEVIAATIGISRNTLRSRHALDLHAGRQIKAAAKAAAPRTKQERARAGLIARIERSFRSHWNDRVPQSPIRWRAHRCRSA